MSCKKHIPLAVNSYNYNKHLFVCWSEFPVCLSCICFCFLRVVGLKGPFSVGFSRVQMYVHVLICRLRESRQADLLGCWVVSGWTLVLSLKECFHLLLVPACYWLPATSGIGISGYTMLGRITHIFHTILKLVGISFSFLQVCRYSWCNS